jgi:hypothetical protein
MSSDKKIEANRENARKSTGPKTDEGKSKSKMNALKHGVLARNTVASGPPLLEDATEFFALLEGLRTHYEPIGPHEDILVQEIAAAKWKTIRLERYEAAGVCARVSEAIDVGRNRVEEERWVFFQKDLRFTLHTAADPAERPHVTAQMLRDQIDLVKRLNRDDVSVDDEPDFHTFVWVEKAGGDLDGRIPDADLEETCRTLLAELSEANLEDLRERFISTMERALEAMWELRAKTVPFEVAVEKALVPDDADLDKIIRYSTYLSRLEERKVAMLERQQATRRKKEGRR